MCLEIINKKIKNKRVKKKRGHGRKTQVPVCCFSHCSGVGNAVWSEKIGLWKAIDLYFSILFYFLRYPWVKTQRTQIDKISTRFNFFEKWDLNEFVNQSIIISKYCKIMSYIIYPKIFPFYYSYICYGSSLT